MIEVTKRDGRIKSFDKRFIEIAVDKACQEVQVNDDTLPFEVANLVEQELEDNNIKEISVEDIQDMVVEQLKVENLEVAKVYQRYREERNKARKHPIDKVINELIEGKNNFLAKENANKNSTLISTQRDLMAGTISRYQAQTKIPKYLMDAHNEGIIKFHDLDYFINPMTNCSLIPLDDLFTNGTVINDEIIETPKSLATAMTLATQIITQVTSFQYGGCTISLSHIAPYVEVSRQKKIKEVKEEGKLIGVTYSENQINAIVNKRLKKEIKDSVQTFNYQISTMNSTNGQSPFTTVFIYLNENKKYVKETAMLAEEFFKQRLKGMKDKSGNYVTQVFPKIIFALDENNIHKDSEYYWLLELAMKSTARRMSPDYESAKMLKELYGDVFPCINKTCA